ncbi:phosphotransferase [Streptomyces uncialis]|uniref:phosphotransferase n=1 Tax=Streptomyces uncialis TaxID=1048205 RepID=UPI0033DCD3BF
MSERVIWDELPGDLRDAVEHRVGGVTRTVRVAEGLNCSLALVIHTRDGDPLFLKGVRAADDAGRAGLLCEELVNGAVGGISPAVRHRFEAAGWLALAFTHIDGRHIDYEPGTGDLEALARTTRRMCDLPAPSVPLPHLSDRFAGHLRPGEADALRGSHLLHTDTNPHNVLISTSGDAHLIDWAMPALGPAWVDAAYLATWLMAYGHTPEEARAWLSGIPGWREADRAAVEAFVNVTCRHWTARVGEKDSISSNDRFRCLLDATHR